MEATGLYRGSIPGSGPVANTDDMQTGGPSQYIMRTILRTIRGPSAPRELPAAASVSRRSRGPPGVELAQRAAGSARVPIRGAADFAQAASGRYEPG